MSVLHIFGGGFAATKIVAETGDVTSPVVIVGGGGGSLKTSKFESASALLRLAINSLSVPYTRTPNANEPNALYVSRASIGVISVAPERAPKNCVARTADSTSSAYDTTRIVRPGYDVRASLILVIDATDNVRGAIRSSIFAALSFVSAASLFAMPASVSAFAMARASMVSNAEDVLKIAPSASNSPTTPTITAAFANLYNREIFQVSESGHSPIIPVTRITADPISNHSKTDSQNLVLSSDANESTANSLRIAALANYLSAAALLLLLILKGARGLWRRFTRGWDFRSREERGRGA